MHKPAVRQPASSPAARQPLSGRWPVMLLALTLTLLLASCASHLSADSARFEALRSALAARDYAQARELIRRYPQTLDERRAVGMAIALGDPHAVELFARQAGANSELDLDGTTPLLRSVTAAPASVREEIVSVLLGLGADPRQADRNGTDAAALARRRGERRLLAMMNHSMGIGSERRPADGPPATAQWMPPPDSTIAAPATNVRGARARAAASKARSASARAVKADNRPLTGAQGLFTDVWIAAPADAERSADVAGIRFHADGTGELLRIGPRQLAGQRLADAYVAWTFEAGRLTLVVVSPMFAARCESQAIAVARLDLQCVDLVATDDEFDTDVRPRLHKVAGGRSQDLARSMVDGPPAGAGLARGAIIRTALHRPAALACKPRMAPRRPAADADYRAGARGDWYAFDLRQGLVSSALSGQACLQQESRHASMALCSRGGGHCLGVGGCRAGTVSAVAGTRGANWAWVACAPSAADARAAALERCRGASGCDCQLLAVSGANVMTQRGADCRMPLPGRPG